MEKYAATHIMKLLYIFILKKWKEEARSFLAILFFYRTHVVGGGKEGKESEREFMALRFLAVGIVSTKICCELTSGCEESGLGPKRLLLFEF